MGYIERVTWSQVIVSAPVGIAYFLIVLPQLAGTSPDDIDWITPMLWSIGVGIVASIALSIVWGIVAGRGDRDAHLKDQRDREIEHFGDRVGQSFLAIGGIAALILAMVDAAHFWIGVTLFTGFFLSAFVGGLARLGAYRAGFQ